MFERSRHPRITRTLGSHPILARFVGGANSVDATLMSPLTAFVSQGFAIIEREQGSDMRGHELRLLGHQQGHYIAQRKTPGFNQVSVARILPLEATIRHARRQRLGEGFRVDMSSIVVG